MKQLGYAQKDGKHFFDIGLSEGYGETEIMNCPDPDGGSNTEMPTAIPSPFARFDLIKTAFENIEKTEALKADADGKRASKSDEKHVSHTLDLAEIVFDYSAHEGADKLGILKWSKSIDLPELVRTHESFADSLKLYLKLDAKAYNFDKMENIFLFRYGTSVDNIIGSTSPITLFCPSASKFAGLGIIRPKDKKPYFGDTYLPLYERSADFQKWFYALLGYFACHGIADRNKKDGSLGLSVIRKYADKSRKFLEKRRSDPELVNSLNFLFAPETDHDFVNKHDELHVAGTNSPVDVLGVDLRIPKKEDVIYRDGDSDFVIAPTKKVSEGADSDGKALPLALQNGFTRPGFKYGAGDFTPDIHVPSFAKGSWRDADREMPGLGSRKGRYVTVSDFLEPYLVRTIYPISKNFLAFDKTDKGAFGYLYPLKKDFFDFFSIKSLNAVGPGNPKISLEFQDDGNVKVSLEVPIKKYGHKVTFERVYKESREQPDENKPDGGIIVTKKFGVSVFPFVKTNGYIKERYGVNPDYRVQFIDSDKETTFSDLEFYSETLSLAPVKKVDIPKEKKNVRFNKTKGAPASSEYYEISEEFDFIHVKTDRDVRALVIPKWKEVSDSSKKYTFAVDFGTTNTHIAYNVGGVSEPFGITGEGNDVQIATLFDETSAKTYENLNEENALEINDLINKEFVPKAIGKDKDYVFPQRTALAYNAEMPAERWRDGLDPLTESNIPFCYEKVELKGDEIVTNLKWNTKDEDPYRAASKMDAYLRQIVMLLQNKVLANGGSLKETRLIWFYPSSMSKSDQDKLESKWKQYFEQYFGKIGDDTSRVVGVMESLAPYYAQNEPKFGGANVLSIDIGGGTTDAAVFFDGKLKGTTSFKFAGNALFGDAYSARGQGADKNGFVIRFAKRFVELLSGGEYSRAAAVLEELQKKKKADDINAFFFSVENNIEHWTKQARQEQGKVAVNKDPYSYSVMIRNNGQDLMFLILYFYVALIYHIGQVLKSMDGEPIKLKFVIFSGTASKILRILTKSNASLTRLTAEVFKHFGLADDNLEVKLAEEPKEATCKGGLSMDFGVSGAVQNTNVKPLVYSCVKNGLESATYDDYLEDSKKEDSLIKKSLVEFHKFFFSLDDPDFVEFSDFFGIDSVVTKYVKSRYERLIDAWITSAISEEQKIYNIQTDKKAQETPFFMPLKGIIQDLSFEIANNAYNKKA